VSHRRKDGSNESRCYFANNVLRNAQKEKSSRKVPQSVVNIFDHSADGSHKRFTAVAPFPFLPFFHNIHFLSYRINDRVISANNLSLEGVDYATAVQVLRDSGQTVNFVVKRRVVLPASAAISGASEQTVRVNLTKQKKKEDFGIVLGCKIYVKEISHRSLASKDGTIQEGDLVHKINGAAIDGLTLKEARKLLETAKDKLDLVVKRDPFSAKSGRNVLKLTNGHAAAPSHGKDPYGEGGYKPNNPNIYVPTSSSPDKNRVSGYAESAVVPPRPPMPPMEEGTSWKRKIQSSFFARLFRLLELSIVFLF
jgi:hypothetical protein